MDSIIFEIWRRRTRDRSRLIRRTILHEDSLNRFSLSWIQRSYKIYANHALGNSRWDRKRKGIVFFLISSDSFFRCQGLPSPLRLRIILIRIMPNLISALEIFHLTFPRQTICRTLRRVLQLGALETSKFQKFFFKLKNFQCNLEMKYKFETSQMRRESWWEWKKER